MTLEQLKQGLCDLGHEDCIVFENPDYADAFIGISHDDRAVYSYDKMIECLMVEDNMTMEDAQEFIDFNTIRAIPYFGPGAPIVVYDTPQLKLYDEDEEKPCSAEPTTGI